MQEKFNLKKKKKKINVSTAGGHVLLYSRVIFALQGQLTATAWTLRNKSSANILIFFLTQFGFEMSRESNLYVKCAVKTQIVAKLRLKTV